MPNRYPNMRVCPLMPGREVVRIIDREYVMNLNEIRTLRDMLDRGIERLKPTAIEAKEHPMTNAHLRAYDKLFGADGDCQLYLGPRPSWPLPPPPWPLLVPPPLVPPFLRPVQPKT